METTWNKWLAQLTELGTTVGVRIIYALIILIVGLKLSGWLAKKLRASKLMEKLDPSVGRFIISAAKVVVDTMVIMSAAIQLGIPATTFVTILGSAGLAIGLALQGSLSNLAGSLLLLTFKPFKVGDYVDAGGVSGTVDEINVLYTQIRTVDNKLITCPNGSLANGTIVNYSHEERRRVDQVFSVGYGCDIELVKQTILDVAAKNDKVLADPAPFVRLSSHGGSSLDFTSRLWVNSADYWDVHFYMLEEVKKAFDAAGIDIPYPQMDVHLSQQ